MSDWWKGCRQCDRADAHRHGDYDETGYEVRYGKDRSGAIFLDGLVARGCEVHLEQMSKSAFWMDITLPNGTHLRVWIETRNRKGWVEAAVDLETA